MPTSQEYRKSHLVESRTRPPVSATDETSLQIGKSYDEYVRCGEYARRYPESNQRVLDIILKHVGVQAHVLDYGCGTGRYLVPLLKSTSSTGVGFDISAEAIAVAGRRLEQNGCKGRAVLVYDATHNVDLIATYGPFDTILLLFGVLSHIPYQSQRVMLLRQLSTLLRPKHDSALILTVPNARRRFPVLAWYHALRRYAGHAVEPATQAHDIVYPRKCAGTSCKLFYHLYTKASLQRELQIAGLRPRLFFGESVLPESWILRHAVLHWVDRMLSRVIPVREAYGIGVVVDKNP